MHSFVLLGIDPHFTFESENIHCLNALPEHVVVIDPLLNHVGRANRYLQEQYIHVNLYILSRIHSVEMANQKHIDNQLTIETDASILVSLIKEQGIASFPIKKYCLNRVTFFGVEPTPRVLCDHDNQEAAILSQHTN